MVVLQPYGLEGSVLVGVLRFPWVRFEIRLFNALSDLLADDGYATESAVKPVTLMQCVILCGGWHAELHPSLFGNAGRRILDRPMLNMRAVAAPRGFGPLPDHRKIGVANQFMSQFRMTVEMSMNSGLQQSSCL